MPHSKASLLKDNLHCRVSPPLPSDIAKGVKDTVSNIMSVHLFTLLPSTKNLLRHYPSPITFPLPVVAYSCWHNIFTHYERSMVAKLLVQGVHSSSDFFVHVLVAWKRNFFLEDLRGNPCLYFAHDVVGKKCDAESHKRQGWMFQHWRKYHLIEFQSTVSICEKDSN